MRTIPALLILVLFTLLSCGKPSESGRRIGMDASWYPLDFGNRGNNVTVFSTELLADIGRIEKIPFIKMTVNWDDLMDGLQKDKYEAILSSMSPYNFNRNLFDFSDIYLPLGPVLVVQEQSALNSIAHLNGKEIAVISGSTSPQILEKSQGVLIRYYDSIPKALNDVLTGTVDGAIINILSATAYCNDIYQGKLKIATDPLSDEGLRLMTKHKSAPDLIKGFNSGLARMKKDGSYAKLMEKWGLQETIRSSKAS